MHASRILHQTTLAASLTLSWVIAHAAPVYQLVDLGAVQTLGPNSAGTMVGNDLDAMTGAQGYIYSPLTGRVDFGEPGEVLKNINDAGQILSSRGLYTNGVLSPIDSDNVDTAYRLNQAGQFTGGMKFSPNEAQRPFLYDGHGFVDLGALSGGQSGFGQNLNNLGQVTGMVTVGTSANGDDISHAFLYANGKMTDLGTLPGDDSSIGAGINDVGAVVGQSGWRRAFLYQNGQMTDLGATIGAQFSDASAINNAGQVVGSAWGDVPQFAYVYREGQAFKLNSLLSAQDAAKWDLAQVFSINEQGTITGYGYLDGELHSYLATPSAVPESGSAASLGMGLLMMGALFALRKNR